MTKENGPENSSQLGEEVYQRLEGSGVFAGHEGETVCIHPATGTYVFGEGATGRMELLKEVRKRPGQSIQSNDDIIATFYPKRVGKLGRVPIEREIIPSPATLARTLKKGERAICDCDGKLATVMSCLQSTRDVVIALTSELFIGGKPPDPGTDNTCEGGGKILKMQRECAMEGLRNIAH